MEAGIFYLEQVLEFMNVGSDVYLAEWNNEIVGTYTLTWSDPLIWQELDNLESGYIHRFAVNRKYRGLDIGKYLLKSAEQQIRIKEKNGSGLIAWQKIQGLINTTEIMDFNIFAESMERVGVPIYMKSNDTCVLPNNNFE